MHIGMVSIPLQSGGAERLVIEEAKYFARAGHEVTLITADYSDAFLDEFDLPANVAVETYNSSDTPSGIADFLTETGGLLAGIRRVDPDVLFTHYKSTHIYLLKRLSSLDVPFTTHVHGSILWFRDNPRLLPHRRDEGFDELVEAVPGHTEFQSDIDGAPVQRTKAEVEEWLHERALATCDLVFTGSERVAEELEVLYDVDAVVVRPGVDDDWLDEPGDDEPTHVELMDRENVVLGLSRLDPRKRFDLLVRAFARLRERRDDVGLVIGGTGSHEETLREIARDEGVEDDVRFAGYIPDDELPAHYRSAEVFACPAWMSYGLAPLEAYGMGTKLALSADTFVKELLADERGVTVAEPRTGDWVDSLDALLDADEEPRAADLSVVPTWSEYCAEKHRILADAGILTDEGVLTEDESLADDGSLADGGSTADDGSTADGGPAADGRSAADDGSAADDRSAVDGSLADGGSPAENGSAADGGSSAGDESCVDSGAPAEEESSADGGPFADEGVS